MKKALAALSLLLAASTAAAAPPAFRYVGGECRDTSGKLGSNNGRGECSNLNGSRLLGARLENANLRGVSAIDAQLAFARLDGADLSGGDLILARLASAELRKTRLTGANLQWANLRRAKLRGADLRGAVLIGANLEKADLREADLRGADLDTREMRKTKLRGAKFDETTRFPAAWGSTHEARKAEAFRRGMAFVAIVPKLAPERCACADVARAPADNDDDRDEEDDGPKEAEYRPTDGGSIPPVADYGHATTFDGRWRMEAWDTDGTLSIRHVENDRYRGSFRSRDGLVALELRMYRSEPLDSGNRMLFEWEDGRGGYGRGWLLVSRDGEAITGNAGWGSWIGPIRSGGWSGFREKP